MMYVNRFCYLTGMVLLLFLSACEPTEETRLLVVVTVNGETFTLPKGATEPLEIDAANACDISLIATGDDSDGVVAITISAESGARLTTTSDPGAEEFDEIMERTEESILPTSLTTGALVVPTESPMVFGFTVESQGGEIFTGPNVIINFAPEEEFACLSDSSTSCIWDFSDFEACEGETADNSLCFKKELDDNEEQLFFSFSKRIEACIGGHTDRRVSRFRVLLAEDADRIGLAIYRNSTDTDEDPNNIVIPAPNLWVDNRFDDWTINANWIFETLPSGTDEIPEGLRIEVELE